MIKMKRTFFYTIPILTVKKGLFTSFLVLMKEAMKTVVAGNLSLLNHLLWCRKIEWREIYRKQQSKQSNFKNWLYCSNVLLLACLRKTINQTLLLAWYFTSWIYKFTRSNKLGRQAAKVGDRWSEIMHDTDNKEKRFIQPLS